MFNLTIPFTWEEFRVQAYQLLTYNGDLRLEPHSEFYQNFLLTKTPEEHVKSLKEEILGQEINLVDNKFPYSKFLQKLPNVKHKMILSFKPLTPAEIDFYLINKCNLDPKDYFWYENQNIKKSRPEIFHVHVFINNFTD